MKFRLFLCAFAICLIGACTSDFPYIEDVVRPESEYYSDEDDQQNPGGDQGGQGQGEQEAKASKADKEAREAKVVKAARVKAARVKVAKVKVAKVKAARVKVARARMMAAARPLRTASKAAPARKPIPISSKRSPNSARCTT